MKDRVPLYPGRVKLTPVSGQNNTYDMVRADAPTQEGTPLSKATFLKDSTAAMFGLGADALPDDILVLLKTITDNHGTAIANGVKIATGSYVGTGTYGSANPCSLTFEFVPKFVIINSNRNRNDGGTPAIMSAIYSALNNPIMFGNDGLLAKVTWNENSINWYTFNAYGAVHQLNESGSMYHYFAFG